MTLERLEHVLQLNVRLGVTVKGASGQGAEVRVLEQLADHNLQEVAVHDRADRGYHVRGGSYIGLAHQHAAEFGDETRASLDERARAQLGGKGGPGLLEPVAVFRQEVVEFAAVVAGAREEVVSGARIQLDGGQQRRAQSWTHQSAGTKLRATGVLSGCHCVELL